MAGAAKALRNRLFRLHSARSRTRRWFGCGRRELEIEKSVFEAELVFQNSVPNQLEARGTVPATVSRNRKNSSGVKVAMTSHDEIRMCCIALTRDSRLKAMMQSASCASSFIKDSMAQSSS